MVLRTAVHVSCKGNNLPYWLPLTNPLKQLLDSTLYSMGEARCPHQPLIFLACFLDIRASVCSHVQRQQGTFHC